MVNFNFKKIILLFLIFLIPELSTAGATGEVLGETAKGAVVGGATGAIKTKVGQAVIGEEASKSIGKFFDTPPGILTMAGIATVYSGVLYNAAANQEEEADNNIKKIDKIVAEFKDSYANYCPEGREDLNNPKCYCYLAKGGQNPDRTRSQTCLDLWAKDNYKLSGKADDYLANNTNVDSVGCITLSGEFDENCRCKKFLNSKGTNACKKSVSINMPAGISSAMVNGTGIKDIVQFAANSANGNPMFNNFSTGQMGLKAINTDSLKNQLIERYSAGSNGNSGVSTINEKNIDKFAKALIGEKIMAAAIGSSRSAFDLGSAGSVDSTTASILKSAAAKAGFEFSGGNGLQYKKAATKEGMNFNFADEPVNGNGQTQNFPEPEKNYNYKNSDISKNSDVSIFEIISNRYIQSGLKRLFDH